jgi:S-adenosylmethionine uptake transporter
MLGQRSHRRDWLAIAGALLGLYMLLQPELKDSDLVGRLLGLASGFLAALAYLMIARAGRSNSPRTVVFYFSLVAVLIHLGWFAWRDCSWPADGQAWALALLAGLTGSAAQSFLTRAYQMAPAAQVSAVAYCGPVMSLMLGALLFKQTPNAIALGGCGLVLLSGMLLPFLSARTAKP